MKDHKDKILEQINDYFMKATDEELSVLDFVLDGLKRKQDKENNSYLGGLLKATSTYDEQSQTLQMSIPNSHIIQNALNIVHGGITATLLDSAMGTLVHHIIHHDLAAVTSEMKINYVAPGIGESLNCMASIIHKGSKTVVCEGKVFRDDGRLIAHSTASFFIIPRRKE